MCGIYGEITSNDTPRETLCDTSLALKYITSRGPDSCGVVEAGCRDYTVRLAHTRLAILDLTELGSQPMEHPNGRYTLVLNGEIYNYIEIRDELVCLGHVFRGGSDTEVLLHAWSRWGNTCLERLNGMFAFALLDKEMNQLWLVRDRFGVKPLLWGNLPGGGICFSSSVAAVASQISSEVDLAYCSRSLHSSIFESFESGSPFEAVKSVSSGSWVRFGLETDEITVSQTRWYNLAEAVEKQQELILGLTENVLAERCFGLLKDAVHLRLRSDVPVAVSLSGGLDSSAVASIALGEVSSLTGFTYGHRNAEASEGPLVQKFSDESGVNVHFVWPHYNALQLGDALERSLASQEAPFPGLSVLAQQEVCRAVRNAGFKVLLGGQGADEAFAGYRKFFLVALRESLHSKSPIESIRLLYSLGTMLVYEARQARIY